MAIIWLFALLTVVAGLPQKTSVIRVQSGELQGIVSSDALQGFYNSYLAIPYAKAERFQGPKPTQWEGIFDATKDNIKCTQRNGLTKILVPDDDDVSGQEDCLTLNVYTPSSSTDQSAKLEALKPVMVFIHGGGFATGSATSNLYGPQYLLRKDVIVVAINYRLEVLGFLCLGIKEAPGNVGLKDQTQALKWVKENIEAFGGDPNNVTIFGESAGSASVMYHLVSPLSKDLFHKAILESGSASSPWAFQYEPIKTASMLAKQMGYDTEDPYELYNIFMNKTGEELLSTRVPRKNGDNALSENIFVPCAEKEIQDVQPFITDNAYNLVSKEQYTKVPMIIGFNDHEGYLFVGKENKTTIANLNFYDSLPRNLQFPTDEDARATADKLRDLYNMNGKNFSKDTVFELSDYEGDMGITYPVVATADIIVKTNDKPTYMYKFSYGGLLNLGKFGSGFGFAPGATHGDELAYLFKPALTGLSGLIETKMIEKMTTMWTNFAKFSDPTPEGSSLAKKWDPTKEQNATVLIIDKEDTTAPLWDSDRLLFWNQTYSQYRRKE